MALAVLLEEGLGAAPHEILLAASLLGLRVAVVAAGHHGADPRGEDRDAGFLSGRVCGAVRRSTLRELHARFAH